MGYSNRSGSDNQCPANKPFANKLSVRALKIRSAAVSSSTSRRFEQNKSFVLVAKEPRERALFAISRFCWSNLGLNCFRIWFLGSTPLNCQRVKRIPSAAAGLRHSRPPFLKHVLKPRGKFQILPRLGQSGNPGCVNVFDQLHQGVKSKGLDHVGIGAHVVSLLNVILQF
jgi:hypothetical protein